MEARSNLLIVMLHFHLAYRGKQEAVHFQLNKTPADGEDFDGQPN